MSLRPSLWRESYCASLFRNLVSVQPEIEAVQNNELKIKTITPFARTDQQSLTNQTFPAGSSGVTNSCDSSHIPLLDTRLDCMVVAVLARKGLGGRICV
jgi:hypothetical protein